MLGKILENTTNNKIGVEIGGPSPNGYNIYDNSYSIYKNSNSMDNVIFSKNTIWSSHTDIYKYYDNKIGKVIINDAVDISYVKDNTYDFCFASHCLEHIANPLRAVKEWLRIIKKDGNIIFILPQKLACFDHKRNFSTFSTLLSQYQKNVGEHDLTTLPEILINHDLTLDPPAGDIIHFTKRSLDNYNNRCLHHYVYSPDLLKEICTYFNCEFIYTITENGNIWFIMKK